MEPDGVLGRDTTDRRQVPPPCCNLFLVGYRCCGKTSVGRLLADRFGWRFVDTDALVVERAGSDIAAMIEGEGWAFFRRLETRILKDVCRRSGQVVATGGGIVLAPENTALMRRCGKVVWLQAQPETILRRMATDPASPGQRPALSDDPVAEEVVRTLAERRPLYTAAMDKTWFTDDHSPDQLAGMIQAAWPSAGRPDYG